MPFVTVGTENTAEIKIHYNDHGSGRPIVLIHGYPLDGNSWERQERVLLANGYRCISYDRRGFGRSSQPSSGYDYDTFAADLKAVLDHLALDQDVVLAGFSMGTGEVTRYLGTYGSAGVSKAILLGVDPTVPAADQRQPEGRAGLGVRRHQAARSWPTAAPTSTTSSPTSTTPTCWHRTGSARPPCGRASSVAAAASPYASYACVDTWLTDFRADLPKIDVPTLVIHGTADRILPFDATAARLRDENLIADVTVVPIENGPHNIGWTYPVETNAAILALLGDTAPATAATLTATSA